MKVLEHTATRLSLLESTNGVKLLGILVFIIGTLITGGIPTKTTESLNCNRGLGTCEIARKGQLDGDKNRSFPADELEGSNVEEDATIDKKGHEHISYKVMLLTKSYGEIFFVSEGDKEDSVGIASQINDFAQNQNQPSLSLSEVSDHSLVKNIIFFVALSIGIVAIMQDDVTYTFDKRAKRLYIKRQGLRGGRVSSEPIHNVSDVTVNQSATRNAQTGKTYYSYKLNLLFSSGKILTIASSSDSAECYTLADSIKQILALR